jgi:2-hydroxy-3-oxopropionate reductase
MDPRSDRIGTVDTIGMVGLGVMGSGIAQCLLRAGFRLKVHARDVVAAATVVQLGAQVVSLAELGRSAAAVVLSVPDTEAVEAILFADDGLGSTLPSGSVIIDTSTISAVATRSFARRLREREIELLDAPVSGGQQGAQQGSLTCMVGGAGAAFQRCEALFQAFSSRFAHLGDSGAGQVTKACNQVAVAGALLGVAEAMALADANGLDMNAVREALLGGSARSFSLEKHAPRVIEGDYAPGFRAVLMRKDLRLALDTARDSGVIMPTAALATQWLEVLVQGGRGDLDWSAIGLLVSELSGRAAIAGSKSKSPPSP